MTWTNVATFVKTHQKLAYISLAGLLAVLIVVAYIFHSLSVWTGIESRSSLIYNQTNKNLREVLGRPVVDEASVAAKSNQLHNLHLELGKHTRTLCEGDELVAWQSNMEAVTHIIDDCHSRIDRIHHINMSLGDAIKYLDDEKSFLSPLAKLLPSSDPITSEDVKSVEAKWTTLIADYKDKDCSPLFKNTKTMVIEKSQGIADAWKVLITADIKKDKVAYMDAQARLNDAYAQLPSISKVSAEQYSAIAEKFSSMYEKFIE